MIFRERNPTLQCTGPARKAAQAGDFERWTEPLTRLRMTGLKRADRKTVRPLCVFM